MRRADEQDRAIRHQDEFRLRQAFTQLRAFARRVAIAGDLDVIADDHLGAAAGDIAADALCHHRRIAQRAVTRHGEAIRRPDIR